LVCAIVDLDLCIADLFVTGSRAVEVTQWLVGHRHLLLNIPRVLDPGAQIKTILHAKRRGGRKKHNKHISFVSHIDTSTQSNHDEVASSNLRVEAFWRASDRRVIRSTSTSPCLGGIVAVGMTRRDSQKKEEQRQAREKQGTLLLFHSGC
jgi:hypothetical protein